MQRGQSQSLFRDVQVQDERQWAQTETQEVPSEHMAKYFYSQSDWTLAQVSQKDIGDSLSLETLNLMVHSPKKTPLADPVLNKDIEGKPLQIVF